MPRTKAKNTMPEMKDFPSCRLGDKNGYVTLIQTNLQNRGYEIGRKGVSGTYDEDLKKAVKEFQKDIGMPVPNGSVGPKTWAALQESKVNRLPVRKEEPKVVPITSAPSTAPAKGTFAYNPLTNQVEQVVEPVPQPVQQITPPVQAPVTCRVLVEGLTKFQAEVLVKMLSGGVSARIL